MFVVFKGFKETAEGELLISTDEMRLQQVLINFQSNALKFTPKGGSITIECEFLGDIGPNGAIQVSVIDTGIGIKPEDIGRLFKQFGFLDSSS